MQMIHLFEGQTADEAWTQAAARFEVADDAIFRQPSRAGNTYELLHTCISIRDPQQRWILSRRPAINPAFAVAEVVWILSGRNDAAFINHWNPALPKFAGYGDSYHGAYGYRLRRQFGLDQLDRAYRTLDSNPHSRQVVLQIWDAESDLPDEHGSPRNPDIPCNVCSMLKIRGGRLDWMQILRSNDIFLGVPHNIIQFTCLQEVVAGWLRVDPGNYHQLSDSLHVYERDAANLQNRVIEPVPHSSDSLMLPKPESDWVWKELDRIMTAMVRDVSSRSDWWKLLGPLTLPMGFQNLLFIVAADDARRRGWLDEATGVMENCTNPVLRLAWSNWLVRKGALNLHQSS
jgi:thymidylate synthase